MSWDFLAFVPQDILEQFSGTMLRILLNRSFSRLYSLLSGKDKEEFDALLAINEVDEKELVRRTAFLEKHLEVFKQILVEEAQQIEGEFADFVEQEESRQDENVV
ncbi:MAG: hypothetical protein KGI50_03205 [Patescibacteria group bacterium]|nr:hypothetical protein [Patescibacteria group bacterium]MDE2438299.1 hypothetical protein [Patescibacteria group bacterium]